MLGRRRFLKLVVRGSAGMALLPFACARFPETRSDVLVNDIHSQLNPTQVHRVSRIDSIAALRTAMRQARNEGKAISIAGGRHSMGGQQFGTDTVLIDTRPMNRVLNFDHASGLVEVEAGIQWPELVSTLVKKQRGRIKQWGIVQKQTGADRLSIGGALSANIHGRGLTFKPVIGDVESFTIIGADGESHTCSRDENKELFSLAIGGYGLFGVITSVKLRLMPRVKLERIVELIKVSDLIDAFKQRTDNGYLYGDCQFSIDQESAGFLRDGVFSCYRPTDASAQLPSQQKKLSKDDWRRLYLLAHKDPKRVFDVYSSYYLATSGQRYWSDTHQLSNYVDDYHAVVDRQLGAPVKGTEMISEVYVPRTALGRFMGVLREDFRRHGTQVIYGTIRLIEKDDESFLPWAREAYACIVMNLHVVHTREKIEKAATDFRRLIDQAIEYGGSYFLTYHRWADRRQVEACYPQMADFIKLKKRYDPHEMFQSDWYRHYRRMFAGAG